MISDKIQQNVVLAPLTTFKIGGPAEFFVTVTDKDELPAAFAWAKDNHQPFFVLGGGSNLLISDRGIKGLVIKLENQEIKQEQNDLVAGAGARLSNAVGAASLGSLSGLEWAAGIPGTIGGAVRGNAGAFGGEIKNVVSEVEYFDVPSGQFKTADAAACAFAYRSSLFKTDNDKIVWQARLALTPAAAADIESKIKELILYRLGRQPKLPSAGCVFKNLLAEMDLNNGADWLRELAAAKGKGGKLACAAVIDHLGLKGLSVGGAKISQEHANFIVNAGGASAADVINLIKLIKQRAVAAGVQLEEEISLIGF